MNSVVFIHIFCSFESLPKILPILLKFVQILKNSVVDFIFQDKKYCRPLLYKFFVKNSG